MDEQQNNEKGDFLMKTKEELNALKEELETVNMKFEELNSVVGGIKVLDSERADIQSEIEQATQQIDENAFLY